MTDREDIAGLAEAQGTRAKLDGMALGFKDRTRRALLLWAIRWCIGVTLIWAITASTGAYQWLWTAGIAVALLSLGLTIAAQWIISRKLSATQTKLSRLEDVLREDHHRERAENDEMENDNGKL